MVDDETIRHELEARYAELARAVESKDHAAFQALRTPDFHTVDQQGRRHTATDMSDRARELLDRIQPPITLTNTIRSIDVRGERATATVRQDFSKVLDIDGELRRVDSSVTQDETWTRTADGWKLSFVGGERDGEYFIDGERFEPARYAGASDRDRS